MEALAAGRMQFMATGDQAETAAGKLTLRVIRGELERMVRERSASDANLYYLDGLELYGGADAVGLPLSDALHPDAATHQQMGERFAELAFSAGAPLSGSEASNGQLFTLVGFDLGRGLAADRLVSVAPCGP